MRFDISAIAFMLLFSTAMTGQQCSDKSATLTQDDVVISGPCNISLLSGDIVTVKETQAYDLKCVTTQGNSTPGNVYFQQSVMLVGNGARFCGTLMSKPFNYDPVFQMTATSASSPSDFNRFTFFEKDRTTGGAQCNDLGSQQIFRQCTGQPCDASAPPPPPNSCPSGTQRGPIAGLNLASLQSGPSGSFTTPPLECDPNDPTMNCPCTPTNSPIIIDLSGDGFFLTDADHGVRFDIAGTGNPIQIAWTAPGSKNAFLALDRDGRGVITSGKELFGNFTP